MGKTLSSFAIKALVQETEKEIKDAKVDKIQQIGKDTFKITFKGKEGKKTLIIELGKRFNLSNYKIDAPSKVSNLSMLFRKHLSGRRLEKIEQYNFDRVVSFYFDDKILIFEFFSHGNIILTDNDLNTIFSFRKEEWKDRSIKRHAKYEYPKQGGKKPWELTKEDLKNSLTEKDIIHGLVKGLKLNGPYAEEICNLTGIDKNKETANDKDLDLLLNAINALFSRKTEAVLQDNEIRPFPLLSQGEIQKKFKTISDAVDDFYVDSGPKVNPKLEKLKKRLIDQEETLSDFEEKIKLNKKKAETLKANYPLITQIINAFKNKEELSQYGARKEKDKIIVDLS